MCKLSLHSWYNMLVIYDQFTSHMICMDYT